MDKMFCFQCQEASKGIGCTLQGVCGKTADVAGLQDLLVFLMKGISQYTTRLRALNVEMPEANKFIVDGLFMTITNANFDKDRFVVKIKEAYVVREKAKDLHIAHGGDIRDLNCDCLTWQSDDVAEMEDKAKVTADSLAAVAQADSIKMAEDAAKAVAAVDSAAKAAMDTISTKVEGAVIGH